MDADRNIVERAFVRVQNAKTVSAKLNGELVEAIDEYISHRRDDGLELTRADVIRSALRRFLDPKDHL